MFPHTSAELLQRNEQYTQGHVSVARFTTEQIAAPKLLIISCLDHRVVPEHFFNLKTNEVPVYRNAVAAGGRAHRAVYDVALLDILTTVGEVLVIHHTNCGLTNITEDTIKERFSARSGSLHDVHFGCFKESEMEDSLKEDVRFLRAHPLIRKDTVVTGAIYNIDSGKVSVVARE